jgi:hypothetical protein
MYSITKLEEMIKMSEDTLLRYERDLTTNPSSLFAKGMVKNTREQLDEFRGNLIFEKRLREKEVVELRFKGSKAQAGRLPLELLGTFAKQFSEALIEAGKHFQFGASSKRGGADLIRKSTEITFERLVPGSTRVFVTGTTNPDLFGNSIFEQSMHSVMALLSAEESDQIMIGAGNVGGSGVKKLNQLLQSTMKGDLEMDIRWTTPEQNTIQWNGNTQALQRLSQTISKITEGIPDKVVITGKLISQSLKGKLEVEGSDKTFYRISFPNALLDSVRAHQIGDLCTMQLTKRIIKNSVTGEEKVNYELDSLVV